MKFPKFGIKVFKFITSSVVILVIFGIVLIVLGQTSAFYERFPYLLKKDSSIYPIIKLIGGALLGSGVFTAIIKSSEYTEIFSKVIEDIIGSKEFIAKRTDKKEYWNMVSKLLYEEKFPLISEQLQDVIANHYLPMNSQFYLEDYNVFVNIKEIDTDYWEHHETIKFKVRPTNTKSSIDYKIVSGIDLPTPNDSNSLYELEEVIVDGIKFNNISPSLENKENMLCATIIIPLRNKDEYQVVIKHKKTMHKKSNPDKRYTAKYIINRLSITVLLPKVNNMVIELYNMGTVNGFNIQEDQENGNSHIMAWSNNGLILPFQGYCLIFK